MLVGHSGTLFNCNEKNLYLQKIGILEIIMLHEITRPRQIFCFLSYVKSRFKFMMGGVGRKGEREIEIDQSK